MAKKLEEGRWRRGTDRSNRWKGDGGELQEDNSKKGGNWLEEGAGTWSKRTGKTRLLTGSGGRRRNLENASNWRQGTVGRDLGAGELAEGEGIWRKETERTAIT